MTISQKGWPVSAINSFAHFVEFACHFGISDATTLPYLFRGQSNAEWQLVPKLARIGLKHQLTRSELLKIEDHALTAFRFRAYSAPNTRFDAVEADDISCWIEMQHHGAPTRLLDWTSSPYVAAYFACRENQHLDGAIWMIHDGPLNSWSSRNFSTGSIEDAVEKKLHISASSPPAVYALKIVFGSPRAVAQQSRMTICLDPLGSHSEVARTIFAGYEDQNRYWIKIVIPAAQKKLYMQRLSHMNIRADSLFPGLDGIGAAIHEFAELESYRTAIMRDQEIQEVVDTCSGPSPSSPHSSGSSA